MPNLVEIGPVVFEKFFFSISRNFALSLVFPLGTGKPLQFNKPEFLLLYDALSQVNLKLAQEFKRKRLFIPNCFRFLAIIFPWKKMWLFI